MEGRAGSFREKEHLVDPQSSCVFVCLIYCLPGNFYIRRVGLEPAPQTPGVSEQSWMSGPTVGAHSFVPLAYAPVNPVGKPDQATGSNGQ